MKGTVKTMEDSLETINNCSRDYTLEDKNEYNITIIARDNPQITAVINNYFDVHMTAAYQSYEMQSVLRAQFLETATIAKYLHKVNEKLVKKIHKNQKGNYIKSLKDNKLSDKDCDTFLRKLSASYAKLAAVYKDLHNVASACHKEISKALTGTRQQYQEFSESKIRFNENIKNGVTNINHNLDLINSANKLRELAGLTRIAISTANLIPGEVNLVPSSEILEDLGIDNGLRKLLNGKMVSNKLVNWAKTIGDKIKNKEKLLRKNLNKGRGFSWSKNISGNCRLRRDKK